MNRGIDVSTYQKTVDWIKVKASGINFAMIKATQGRSEANPSLYLFTDSQFKRNIVAAHSVALRCGVYHYLTATTVAGAKEEAAYFLKTITPYKPFIDYYVAVDVESKYLPNDKELLTQIVNVFCTMIKQEGYQPVVYTNPTFLTHRLNNISSWKLWLALWRNKSNVPTVAQYPNLVMWQWGSETVDGITSGKVDADFEIVDDFAKTEQMAETSTTPTPDTTTPNEAEVVINYAEEVCKKAGLQVETRTFLDCYKYGEDLWKKLYEAMM